MLHHIGETASAETTMLDLLKLNFGAITVKKIHAFTVPSDSVIIFHWSLASWVKKFVEDKKSPLRQTVENNCISFFLTIHIRIRIASSVVAGVGNWLRHPKI